MSIVIKPMNAQLMKGTDFVFFKKSPYVVCQVGGEIRETIPNKSGGKEPIWSDTLVFRDLGPILRVTLMDKKTIGKDEILGEGQIDISPAYFNPYIKDDKYVDILKNGVIFARVYCAIEYQGNAMNSAMGQEGYNIMSSMISNDIGSMINPMNNSNVNTNMGMGMNNNMNMSNMGGNNMGMVNNENINHGNFGSEVKSIIGSERPPMSPINNSRIEQLGYSNVKPISGSHISTIESTLPATTIYRQTTLIPTQTVTVLPTIIPSTTVTVLPRITTTTTTTTSTIRRI